MNESVELVADEDMFFFRFSKKSSRICWAGHFQDRFVDVRLGNQHERVFSGRAPYEPYVFLVWE